MPNSMSAGYDAVIVGAGHNGLVAAGYLAEAGLSVLVLERRDVVGGSCVTEELFPGFRVSTCSYICHLLQRRVVDDLELAKHGLRIHTDDKINDFNFIYFYSIKLYHYKKRGITTEYYLFSC